MTNRTTPTGGMPRKGRAKRPCYACNAKPAKRLKTHNVPYRYATDEPVFCSRACAADWGLLQAGVTAEGQPYWCSVKEVWTEISEGDSCHECGGECHS